MAASPCFSQLSTPDVSLDAQASPPCPWGLDHADPTPPLSQLHREGRLNPPTHRKMTFRVSLKFTKSFGICHEAVPWAFHNAPLNSSNLVNCMPCRSPVRSSVSQRTGPAASPRLSNAADSVPEGTYQPTRHRLSWVKWNLEINHIVNEQPRASPRDWHAGQGPMPTIRHWPAPSGTDVLSQSRLVVLLSQGVCRSRWGDGVNQSQPQTGLMVPIGSSKPKLADLSLERR